MLKFLGYKNYRGKWDATEILVDLLIFIIVSGIIGVLYE